MDGTATLSFVPTAAVRLVPSKVLPEYLFPLFPGN